MQTASKSVIEKHVFPRPGSPLNAPPVGMLAQMREKSRAKLDGGVSKPSAVESDLDHLLANNFRSLSNGFGHEFAILSWWKR
jgi:hypothetical protein